MKKVIFILLNLFILFECNAQKEADNWFFGDYAAISFKTGSPQVLTGSVMATDEGCTSISDSSGNLLFYTDGSYIWNKNHQIMTNGSGLKGNLSSTQSAIVVKKPNSFNLYYVFTLDAFVGSNGFQYSVVDINKQGGLGEVVTKNVYLTNGLSEKISVARSCDNNSYWIVVHEYNSNKFLSYQFDKNGLNSTPVTTNIGSNHNHGNPTKSDCSGYMKISPNGKKIACAIGYTKKVEIFDFDNLTGRISNSITIDNMNQPYGLEFSPNSNLLYVTEIVLNTVLQYDISNYNVNSIESSKLTIGSLSGTYGGPLQMANNGKMYAGSRVSSSISCINYPDIKGTGCSFTANALNLGSGRCRFGFPNILPNYFSTKSTNNKLIIKEGCINSASYFGFTDSSIVSDATWYFGDSKNSISKKFTSQFTYKDTGTYQVKLVYSHSVCTKDSLTYTIRINDRSKPNIGNDLKLCVLAGTLLTCNINANKYQWNNSNSDTFKTYIPKRFGQHILKTYSNCGTFADTVLIDSLGNNAPFSLGNDTLFCNQFNYQLKAPANYTSYKWNTGDTTASIVVQTKGKYWVTTTNKCGLNSDTISILNVKSVSINLGNDTTLCAGNSLDLKGPPNCKQYVWSNNAITQNTSVSNFGTHFLIVLDSNNCPATDTILIGDKKQILTINLGADTTYCGNFSRKLSILNYPQIKWSTNETTPSITITQAGNYAVSVFNGCFWESDTIAIKQVVPSLLNLGPDTSICFARPFALSANGNFIQYLWNTGQNTADIAISKPGKYWCKIVDNNLCETTDTIEFKNSGGNVEYFIPNAFSPNTDNVNETFPFLKQEPNTVIKIFNRWGELIFQNNEGFSWNGQFKNEFASQDVYLYLIEYRNCNRTKQTLSGTFTLLK